MILHLQFPNIFPQPLILLHDIPHHHLQPPHLLAQPLHLPPQPHILHPQLIHLLLPLPFNSRYQFFDLFFEFFLGDLCAVFGAFLEFELDSEAVEFGVVVLVGVLVEAAEGGGLADDTEQVAFEARVGRVGLRRKTKRLTIILFLTTNMLPQPANLLLNPLLLTPHPIPLRKLLLQHTFQLLDLPLLLLPLLPPLLQLHLKRLTVIHSL